MKLAKQDLGKVAITVDKNYWNAIKSYDRLVIVEVMGVGCYLSRKPVPSGIQYDNREYWIKLTNLNEDSGGSVINLVTEFGDSVDVGIAQKTITDRFQEVYEDTHFQDTFVPHVNLPIVAGYWHLKEVIQGNYDDFTENRDSVETQINDANGRIDETLNDIENLHSTIDDEIRALDLVTKISRKVGNVLYGSRFAFISGQVIDMGSATKLSYYLKRMFTRLGIDYDNSGSSIPFYGSNYSIGIHANLSCSELNNLLHYEQIRSNNFANTGAIVIQLDGIQHTIGNIEDIPTYGSSEYANNMYGSITKYLDDVHTLNPNCQIFLVAPPVKLSDEYVNDKITAIENIAKATGSRFINPNIDSFSKRYTDMYSTIIMNAGQETEYELTILSQAGTRRWVDYVADYVNRHYIYYSDSEND